MSKGLEALEVSKQLKDFVLEFVKNGLDRMFVKGSFDILEKELKEYEQHKAIRKEWKCGIAKVNEMLKQGYWVKYGTKEKGFTYKNYVPNDENIVCLRHLGYDVEICCITSKNEWNAQITGFNEISLSEYGTRLALTKEELGD